MKRTKPLFFTLLATTLMLAAGLAAGCGSKSQDIGDMSKADQEKAFRGDPSKVPDDIKKKYLTGNPPAVPAPPVSGH